MNRLVSSLPSWFRDLPVGKQAVEQAIAADQDEMTRLAGELKAIDAEAAKRQPELTADVRAAEAAVAKAKTALKSAESKLAAALSASLGYSASLESRRSQIEAKMRPLADERIDQFIAKLKDEWAKTRKLLQFQDVALVRDGVEAAIVSTSNSQSVSKRLQAIIQAQRDTEQLRFTPGDISPRLEAIRNSLPAIEPAPSLIEAVESHKEQVRKNRPLTPRERQALRYQEAN